MAIDIFIKTYHKDFQWLQYCLKSIEKFASGFRNIIIVSDNDEHKIPDEYLISNCKVFYVDIPKKQPTYVEHGIGYLWQQYIKLSWYDYTDAEAVIVMDSDEMFTCLTTPESFKENNKFRWFYRDWKDAGNGICWKSSTDFILKVNTEFDAMCITGFILQKETTISLKNHLCSLHNTANLWEIFLKYDMKTLSEFNIFGSFIHHFDSHQYTKIYNGNVSKYHNFTILKSWSWGGISEEDNKTRNTILNS